MNKDKEDYKVIFGGATITKKEAKKVGVAFLFGMLGFLSIGLVFGITNKTVEFITAFIIAGIGYFGIANKIFKE